MSRKFDPLSKECYLEMSLSIDGTYYIQAIYNINNAIRSLIINSFQEQTKKQLTPKVL